MRTGSSEWINNLVILGRAAPEELSDGRQTVCTGAWSPNRGFIRIYPVNPRSNIFSRWDVVNVEVERNPDDSRHESWKIKGRKQDQEERVEVKGEFPRDQRATLLSNLEDDCVNDINEARRSLGIIKPQNINGLVYEDWEDDDEGYEQLKLFQDQDEFRPENRDDFEHKIKIDFECPDCKTQQGYHRPSLLEWGAYMGLRNGANTPEELESNYQMDNPEYDHWIFVGNMNQYKSTFIAISILWIKFDVPVNSTLKSYPKVAPDFEPAD